MISFENEKTLRRLHRRRVLRRSTSTSSVARRRNRRRMRAMRHCVRGALRSNREVIQTAFDRVAARVRRVVAHPVAGDGRTPCHTNGLVGPLSRTDRNGDVAEALTSVSAEIHPSACRSSMHAMRGRIRSSCRRVIRAASECIAHRISGHPGRKRRRGSHTAIHTRVLLLRSSRAIGHDCIAIRLCRGHRPAAPARTAGSTARAATATGGTADITGTGRTRRTGRRLRIVTASERQNGSRTEQEAYEKNAGFGHFGSLS